VKPVSGAGPGGAPRLGPTLADVGEDALVRAVLGRYRPAPGFLLVPAGDDAAVLEVPPVPGSRLVVSTDTLVEGADFRRDWSGGRDVGVKLAAQNFADIAAMGARPLALVVSMAAPPALPLDWATALADGLDDETARAGAAVAGGDVSQSAQLVLTGTALGVLAGRPVLRSGARPGDVVALAGRTGPSAAGLALSRRRARPRAGSPSPGAPREAPPGSRRAPADGRPSRRRRRSSARPA